MTANGLHDTGEEWAWKTAYRQDLIVARDTEIEVLLYNDSTDGLTDPSDVDDVTSEPGGANGGAQGNYTRRPLALDGADLSLEIASGDARVTGTVTFDVTDATGTVDARATVVDLQSDIVNSEGSQNPHLLDSAPLDSGSSDLSGLDELDISVNIDLN